MEEFSESPQRKSLDSDNSDSPRSKDRDDSDDEDEEGTGFAHSESNAERSFAPRHTVSMLALQHSLGTFLESSMLTLSHDKRTTPMVGPADLVQTSPGASRRQSRVDSGRRHSRVDSNGRRQSRADSAGRALRRADSKVSNATSSKKQVTPGQESDASDDKSLHHVSE